MPMVDDKEVSPFVNPRASYDEGAQTEHDDDKVVEEVPKESVDRLENVPEEQRIPKESQ